MTSRNVFTFTILTLSTILLNEIFNYLLQIDDLVVSYLSQQYKLSEVKKTISVQKKWEWIRFVILPFSLLIKVLLISLLIDTGCFFYELGTHFKKILNVVIKLEFISLGVIVLKILWFYFFYSEFSLEDVQYFYPLSALNIVGYENLDKWFVYPLQMINFFEIVYWICLVIAIKKITAINLEKSLVVIASSYGVGLLIWVIFIMFLTLNFS